ncbi:MAG: hypothetical protein IPJ77_07910 [Planctomycetes bacterium]|nr:hypothetical protein [Planctomycetota bacterium]
MISNLVTSLVLASLAPAPRPFAVAQDPRVELARPEAARERSPAAQERVLVVYDVRDLVGGAEAELAPVDRRPGALPLLDGLFVKSVEDALKGAGSDLDRAAAKQAARASTLDLARFVLARLAPKPEASDFQLECPSPGSIALVAKPELQKRFEAFVVEQRASASVVDLQVRYVEGTLADFAPLGVTRESGPKALSMSPEELDRGLRSGRFDVIAAPRLLSHPLQRASISVFDESKYVQDWTVEKVVPGPKEIAVPVLGTLRVGQEIAVRAAVLAKGDIALQLAVERSQLVALRNVPTTLKGAGNPVVEIALPEVETTRVSADGLVANGGTLAFLVCDPQGGAEAKDARELLVLVTARLVAGTK